jgi:hypothetical protein
VVRAEHTREDAEMTRRRIGLWPAVVGLLFAAACAESGRSYAPTAPDVRPGPFDLTLAGDAPVTVPGTEVQLRTLQAPLWMFPSCPAGQAERCGPLGPGAVIEITMAGRRQSVPLFLEAGLTSSTVFGYAMTLLSVEPRDLVPDASPRLAIVRARIERID